MSESDKTVFVYYTIKGTDVRITNYSTSGAGDEGSVASESFQPELYVSELELQLQGSDKQGGHTEHRRLQPRYKS